MLHSLNVWFQKCLRLGLTMSDKGLLHSLLFFRQLLPQFLLKICDILTKCLFSKLKYSGLFKMSTMSLKLRFVQVVFSLFKNWSHSRTVEDNLVIYSTLAFILTDISPSILNIWKCPRIYRFCVCICQLKKHLT